MNDRTCEGNTPTFCKSMIGHFNDTHFSQTGRFWYSIEEFDFQYEIIFNANSSKIGCLYKKRLFHVKNLEFQCLLNIMMCRMTWMGLCLSLDVNSKTIEH